MRSATLIRSIAYALDSGLAALFGFAILVLAARGSDLATFGTFALTLAIVGIQAPLALMGIGGLFYGRAASRPVPASRLYWSGILSCIVFGPVLYAVTLGLLWVAAPSLLSLYALAGMRVVGAFGEPLRSIYQARSQPGAFVPLRMLTLSAAFFASGTAFVVNADIHWFAAIWGAESLIFSGLLLITSLRRGSFPLVLRPRFRPVLRKASPLLVNSICIAIYMRFDQLYIGWRFGEADLGVYAAAARVAETGVLAYGLIALVVSPRIIKEWISGALGRPALAVLAFSWIGSLAAGGLCLLWGDSLLRWTFGPAFAAGGTILAVYVLSTCFTLYGTIGSNLNVAQGATIPSMLSGLVGATTNVGLTILLCEVQGPLGAATATVFSYALSAAVVWQQVIYGPRSSSQKKVQARIKSS